MPVAKTLALMLTAAVAVQGSAVVREHVLYDAVSLNGAWEMAYQPYAWESREMPVFRGVTVARAVPGYREDMIGDLAQL